VNLNGRANNLAAQVVSFLKEPMHVPLLHQANEGNEEFVVRRKIPGAQKAIDTEGDLATLPAA